MSIAKIDASPEAKGIDQDLRAVQPKTVEEFEVLLGRYKAQSPQKYEEKLANRVFDRQAKILGVPWKSEAVLKEEAEAKAKAEKEAEEKAEAEKLAAKAAAKAKKEAEAGK